MIPSPLFLGALRQERVALQERAERGNLRALGKEVMG